LRGPIFKAGYRPQFSGHETFPLRYGWLKKAFDAVYQSEKAKDNKSVFSGDEAIADFGVGRNMALSMRHWATAAGIIEEKPNSNTLKVTDLGRKIFGPRGRDPFIEHPATLWLIHWNLSGHPDRTTWYWAFNHYPALTFDREHIVKGLEMLASTMSWSRVASSTIKRDVECFVRTYAAYPTEQGSSREDDLESPLTELGLIKAVGRRDSFRFVRGPKTNLPDGVFVYALFDFWTRYAATHATTARTLAFEKLAYEPGSPGRVFLLDENDLADRLMRIDEITDGALRWSETSGLKQIIRDVEFGEEAAIQYVERDYRHDDGMEAA
jgi:hypothetical protein